MKSFLMLLFINMLFSSVLKAKTDTLHLYFDEGKTLKVFIQKGRLYCSKIDNNNDDIIAVKLKRRLKKIYYQAKINIGEQSKCIDKIKGNRRLIVKYIWNNQLKGSVNTDCRYKENTFQSSIVSLCVLLKKYFIKKNKW